MKHDDVETLVIGEIFPVEFRGFAAGDACGLRGLDAGSGAPGSAQFSSAEAAGERHIGHLRVVHGLDDPQYAKAGAGIRAAFGTLPLLNEIYDIAIRESLSA